MGHGEPLSRRLQRLMIALLISVLMSCGGSKIDGRAHTAAPLPDLPEQTLLSSSMREQPVPGWTVTVAELRLPPDTVVRPIGNIGDSGIFLGIADEGWWLLGLDLTSGRRTFEPVRLGSADGATDFKCFINGPPAVLCVRHGTQAGVPSTAWVVDTSSGATTFEGLTNLRVADMADQPRLEQVGVYAIATVVGKGVYGVGGRGELTWFVPGNGNLPTRVTDPDHDIADPPLAVQGSGGVQDVVFSISDGRVIKPRVAEDVSLNQAFAYPGGFAYQYTEADNISDKRVALFDDTGKRLDDQSLQGTLDGGSRSLPMLVNRTGRQLLTINGRRLLELPPSLPPADARLIKSRYFVAVDPGHSQWQQFDLLSKAAGKTCDGHGLGYYYIGSDGDVAVSTNERASAEAVDLATCDVLWSLQAPQSGEAVEVWKVNTTLVQRTNDRLFSLVAPS